MTLLTATPNRRRSSTSVMDSNADFAGFRDDGVDLLSEQTPRCEDRKSPPGAGLAAEIDRTVHRWRQNDTLGVLQDVH